MAANEYVIDCGIPASLEHVGSPAGKPTSEITPPGRWFDWDFQELWGSRELLFFFVWRDLKVRYKQTVIGVAWVVIQPLLTMLVFSFFFGRLAKMPSEGLPYPLFYYCALLPWMYFAAAFCASALTAGSAAGGLFVSDEVKPASALVLAGAALKGLVNVAGGADGFV